MFKLTIELEGRKLFVSCPDLAAARESLKEALTAERGWFSFTSENEWVILSSDQLRKAFIKIEDLR